MPKAQFIQPLPTFHCADGPLLTLVGSHKAEAALFHFVLSPRDRLQEHLRPIGTSTTRYYVHPWGIVCPDLRLDFRLVIGHPMFAPQHQCTYGNEMPPAINFNAPIKITSASLCFSKPIHSLPYILSRLHSRVSTVPRRFTAFNPRTHTSLRAPPVGVIQEVV